MPGREIRHQFSVTYQHRVIFTDSVLEPINPTLADTLQPAIGGQPAKAIMFIDGAVACSGNIVALVADYFRTHAGRIALAADPIIIPGGEAAKQDGTTFDRCVAALRDAGIDRHSYMIAIGGGAVLDATGFAASVVHRGVRQVRIPTTVLAQADAGIGIKNAINYHGSKNFLGCFAPPAAVINDFTLLASLPPQQWRDGTVEAVKVALLRDGQFLQWIEDHVSQLVAHDPDTVRHLIFRCAQLHLEHIATAGDPFELGSARPLDFGHWAAHKLEQLSGYRISHGHAVAVGIALDMLYAQQTGLLPQRTAARVISLLNLLGFRMDIAHLAAIDHPGDLDALLAGLEEFREHLGGQLTITTLRDIAQPVELHDLDRSTLRQCAENLLFPAQS